LRWLREWQEVRERAAAFKSASRWQCEALEALSREAYAEWADVLNERASEALTIISPAMTISASTKISPSRCGTP